MVHICSINMQLQRTKVQELYCGKTCSRSRSVALGVTELPLHANIIRAVCMRDGEFDAAIGHRQLTLHLCKSDGVRHTL